MNDDYCTHYDDLRTALESVERAGFEPAIQVAPYAGLANRCLQPLGHLSRRHNRRFRRWFRQLFGCQVRVEEEEGFEPPVLSHNGFQDRRLKPLGHSSKRRSEKRAGV